MFSGSTPLTGDLLKLQQTIRGYAVGYGLDFFEVIFEECDYDTINILAAQGGFPTRYPHWRFGMEYDQLSKSYAYGLSKIYEMVINTDPSYAYLLKGNHWVDQKIVMCHVYGHSDFFKNNAWFKNTNRKMLDVMANHGAKIRRYMEKYGADEVENFIDKVHSLENLLDPYYLYPRPLQEGKPPIEHPDEDIEHGSEALKSYLRGTQPKKVTKKVAIDPLAKKIKLPERDILKFLSDEAPLADWELDMIGILREEAYYFLPQRMTKIMNEGWASYWHAKMMTEKAVTASELIDFADHHAAVLVMSRRQINPYKIGIELFRDIEYRWDTGKFGKAYFECTNLAEKEHWDLKTLQGRDKIFEVRKTHNDVTFIDEFLTPEFCNRMQLFTYKFNHRTKRAEVDTRDFAAIKANLLSSLANFGTPVIEVVNANYANRSELLLQHRHHGTDLDVAYAELTLKNLFTLWKRPVNLATLYEGKETVLTFDGKNFTGVS